jgi:putative PIN family toxin of toxin-antitoxin system
MRVVLDTNVLVSALFWGGQPRRVVDMAIAGRVQAVTSAELLLELAQVLAEDLEVPQDKVELVLRDVLSYAEVTVPVEEVEAPVRDPGDRKVITCAVAGRADYIVTGDRDLLALGQVHGVAVLSVHAFLSSVGR